MSNSIFNQIITPFYNGLDSQILKYNVPTSELFGSLNSNGSFQNQGSYFNFNNFNYNINPNLGTENNNNSEPQPIIFANPVAGQSGGSQSNPTFIDDTGDITNQGYCDGSQWNFLYNSSFGGIITTTDNTGDNYLFNILNNTTRQLQYVISGTQNINTKFNYTGFIYLLGYLDLINTNATYKFSSIYKPTWTTDINIANNIEVIWVPPHMIVDVLYESQTNCPSPTLFVVRIIGFANENPQYISTYYTNPSDWVNNTYSIDNIYVQNIYAYNNTIGTQNYSSYPYNGITMNTTSSSAGFVNLRCILGINNNGQWINNTCSTQFISNGINPSSGMNDKPTKIMVYYKGTFNDANEQTPMYWNIFVNINCNPQVANITACGNIGSPPTGTNSYYNSKNYNNFTLLPPSCTSSSNCGNVPCYTSSCSPYNTCVYNPIPNCTNTPVNPGGQTSCSAASNCPSCKSGYTASCTSNSTCTCIPSSSTKPVSNTKKFVEEGLVLLLIIIVFIVIIVVVVKYMNKKQSTSSTEISSNVEFIPIQ